MKYAFHVLTDCPTYWLSSWLADQMGVLGSSLDLPTKRSEISYLLSPCHNMTKKSKINPTNPTKYDMKVVTKSTTYKLAMNCVIKKSYVAAIG